MGKRKPKVLLMAVTLLIMALAMGSVAYAQTYSSGTAVAISILKVGDILEAGTSLSNAGYNQSAECTIDGEKVIIKGWESHSLKKTMIVKKFIEYKDITSSEDSCWCELTLETYTAGGTDTPGSSTDTPSGTATSTSSSDTEKSTPVDPVAAWKASNANPDNYLPKTTLADGTVVQSTVSSHFTGDEAAVIAATPEADFNKALGISGGYAHIMGSVSQCGEKLKAVFNDYAKLLGDDVKVGNIFDLTTEVREKSTYKLLDTVKESSEPVTLSKELQGELLKAAKAGCDFAVICYTDGKAILCKDADTEVSTITINTTITSGTYAIIYGPKGCFDGIQ